MATSGNFNTNSCQNRCLTFSWSVYERSIEYNYTKIYWELKGGGSYSGWVKCGPISVNIDGEVVHNSSTRIQVFNGTLLASGYKTIYHNPDGSRKFSASASAAIYETTVNCSGSGNWDLEPIPRQATIGVFSNGSDKYDYFTDEDNPVVYYSNPAGASVTVQTCMSWTGGADIAYRNVDTTSDHYMFELTDDERDVLRAATVYGSTSRKVTVYITTIIGSQVYYSTKEVTFEVINCNPEFNPTVIDKGSGSTTLTGSTSDNPKMIRGFNCLYASFNIDPDSLKGASITSKTVTCGGKTLYGDGYFGDGITYHVYDNVFVFSVTDNRGQTVSKTVTMPAIDYIPLTCNVSYDTELDPETNTANIIATISGNYFNNSFGAQYNNLTLRINGSIGSLNVENWEDITPTFSDDGTYTATKSFTGISYKDTFVIQAYAKDKINTSGLYTKEQIVKIAPVFDWGENDFNFNVPVFVEGKQVATYGDNRIARAFTQETDITYTANSYIKLFRDNSPTDLYDESIATFEENGLITINKDMTALVNVHIQSSNSNGRSWIRLMNYNSNWRYTECIAYGSFTTSQITIILKLSAGTKIGVLTSEPITINASGLVGSYIEIMEL